MLSYDLVYGSLCGSVGHNKLTFCCFCSYFLCLNIELNLVPLLFSELVLGSIEQQKEDRKQQLKDQAEEERRMKILTS